MLERVEQDAGGAYPVSNVRRRLSDVGDQDWQAGIHLTSDVVRSHGRGPQDQETIGALRHHRKLLERMSVDDAVQLLDLEHHAGDQLGEFPDVRGTLVKVRRQRDIASSRTP